MTPAPGRSAKPRKKPSPRASTPASVLYLYAISEVAGRAAPSLAAEAIDGSARVEAVRCEGYLCWISRVSRADFADHLAEHMENLEWLATAGLRHQRVVAEISARMSALPARFGTVFLTESSLVQHMRERQRALRDAFQRVADADEWGVKIFALARSGAKAASEASSGSDYLKRKAELLKPRNSAKPDEAVLQFVAEMTKLAAAATSGGKASAGQPGLVWHGSFLVRRKDRNKLESTLQKYAAQWKDVRRIDCSGPWPPYSFVGEHD